MEVTKDYNANVLRFNVTLPPRSLPPGRAVAPAVRTQVGLDFSGARSADGMPLWLSLIRQMIPIPSGRTKELVALVVQAVQAAEAAGLRGTAQDLRAIGAREVNPVTLAKRDMRGLKARMMSYAAKAFEASAQATCEAKDRAAAAVESQYFRPGQQVTTPVGRGFLVDYRPSDDMCVVRLSYGTASIRRGDVAALHPTPHVPAAVLMAGAGAGSGNPARRYQWGEATSGVATVDNTKALSAALDMMRHERGCAPPSAIERHCAAALATSTARCILETGRGIRADPAKLRQLTAAVRATSAPAAIVSTGAPSGSAPLPDLATIMAATAQHGAESGTARAPLRMQLPTIARLRAEASFARPPPATADAAAITRDSVEDVEAAMGRTTKRARHTE